MIQWSDRGLRPMYEVPRTYSRMSDMNHDRREKLFFFRSPLIFSPPLLSLSSIRDKMSNSKHETKIAYYLLKLEINLAEK